MVIRSIIGYKNSINAVNLKNNQYTVYPALVHLYIAVICTQRLPKKHVNSPVRFYIILTCV